MKEERPHHHMSIVLNNSAVKKLKQGCLWFSESDCIGRRPRIAGIERIFDKGGKFVAYAFLSPDSRYFLRVIACKDETIGREFWRERIVRANERRMRLFDLTDAYRVVYSESDGIPSVIIDRYNDLLAFQISSSGAETIKKELIELLIDIFHPASIIEKKVSLKIAKPDVSPAWGQRESLENSVVYGEKICTTIKERNQRFELDVLAGQKTGAYLDYRRIRFKARELAKGRSLDAFCYQGWFSCQIAGATAHVIAVDSSQQALDAAKKNAALNNHKNIEFVKADAFKYLAECRDHFDFIHIDPPAMAKEHAKLAQAIRGYKKLVTNALRILNDNGVLMISSCSHKISERMLEEAVTESLVAVGKKGEIIWRGVQDMDHPIMRNMPESLYLKAVAVQL